MHMQIYTKQMHKNPNTFYSVLSFLILLKSRLNTFQGAEVIGVCVVALFYHCLSLDMYVYHNSNLQKAC